MSTANADAVWNLAETAGPLAVSRPLAPCKRIRTRVAILSTWHPEPVDNGRKQRTRQIIMALAATHDIVLISLLPPVDVLGQPLPPVPGVWQQYVFPLPVFHPHTWLGLFGWLSPYPRSLVATWKRGTAEAVYAAIAESGARAVIGTDLRTLRYLQFLRQRDSKIHTILDEPDVSPFEAAPGAASMPERMRHGLRYRKYHRLLQRATNDLDAFVVASEREARAFAQLSGSSDALIIGNGVSRFPAPWIPTASRQLLYTGSLSYAPNAEAVGFFTSSILPYIAERIDGVTLAVTGALPAVTPTPCNSPDVHLAGRLDDLEPIYRESRVFVAPIRSGTGTRIKLLEAMAIGIPIVTTSKGVEGIPVSPGEHVLIADDPAEFARATLAVLTDDKVAQTLGERGRAFVMRNGNWETSAEQFRQLVRGMLDGNA